MLKVILNVDLSDTIWKQATLPVLSGGCGVRLSMDLALPAFLSSVNGALELTLLLLPSRLHSMSGNRYPIYIAACLEWQTRCGAAVPDPSRAGFRRYRMRRSSSWNMKRCVSCTKPSRACPTYCGCWSSFWRRPCSSVGMRFDDTLLRIAISLRLGATMRAPHSCICGMQVDSSGVHGLACRKSIGRHMRHNGVNDLIKRALASANQSLEPCYLPVLRRTRLNVGKWWNITHCRLYTASCQWRSSHLVRWARRRPTSSATSHTGSCLWQLSRGHFSSWCSGWVCVLEMFRLQSDWTNFFLYIGLNCC